MVWCWCNLYVFLTYTFPFSCRDIIENAEEVDEEEEEEEEEEEMEGEGEREMEDEEYDDDDELNVQYVEDFDESDDDDIEEYTDVSQLVKKGGQDAKRKRSQDKALGAANKKGKGPRVEIEYEEEEAGPVAKQRVKN